LYWGGTIICFVYFFSQLVGVPGDAIRSLPEPWNQIILAICALVWVAGVVVVVPWATSWLNVDQAAVGEKFAARLEPGVDELAKNIGVDFEACFFEEVERRLDAKNQAQARRIHHDATGSTWHETDRALANWPISRLEYKLAAIREHIASSRGMTI
jgi:hypothetical protein